MLPKKPAFLRGGNKFGAFVCVFLSVFTLTWGQAAGTGVVRGRVLNESTGNYLSSALVAVKGTEIQAYTNNNGEYQLSNVPAGEVVIVSSYIGMEDVVATAQVTADQAITQDFALEAIEESAHLGDSGKVIKLDTMSIRAKDLSAQAVAATVKRNAGNIKDVIVMDEFADQADGNIGEFIKFTPGLDIQYNPFNAASVTIRGMPATGTLVQFDGMPTAPAAGGNTRSFDLNTAANANIERIEVTKSPTPDLPANSVGGAINVISKSGFSRAKPLFSYNLYLTYNAIEGEFSPSFSKAAGPDDLSTVAPVQFAYDLSYILPVNKKLAFTLALTRAPRFNQVEYRSPGWNKNTGILNNYQFNELLSNVDLLTAKATVDWRIADKSTLQVSFHKTDRKSLTRQNFDQFTPGAGSTGDANFIQGAANGVGNVAQNLSGNQQYRSLDLASVKYTYEGSVWKFDAFASYSEGGFDVEDMDDGFFGTVASNYTGLVVGATGLSDLSGRGIPDITVTKGGVAVDPWDASHNSINTVTSAASTVSNEVTSVGANLGRDLNFAVPTRLKVGAYQEIMKRDNTGGVKTWTFTPPGGAAAKVASNHDVFADAFSQRAQITDVDGKSFDSRYLSLAKLYDLYLKNPTWFVLNEATAYTNMVNTSIDLTETLTAAYARMDHRFMNNKLWLVYGVRYEHTEDDGAGPLSDPGATYQKDANGNFIRNANGQLIKITTNALANAKLQYTERGAKKKTSYDGFYPSINASYSFSEHMVARASYARTIGRPDLDEIIPSISVVDPNSSATKAITVVDGSLKPWTSDSFDATFEVYDVKGATASVSVFQKNMTDFFSTDESQVTPEELEEFGLPDDYADYTVRRKSNSGDAKIQGFELSYRQNLGFLPYVGRNLQFFANATTLSLSGENSDDFEEYSPHNFNAGLSYINRRFVAKVNMTHNGLVRRSRSGSSATQTTDAFNWRESANRWDLSLEYRITKRFSVYYAGRNIFAAPVRLQSGSSETLGYLRPANYQFVAANHTLGIKGTF